MFLFEMLDNSILNIAMPTIGRELGASATELQWITSAYAIVFGGFLLAVLPWRGLLLVNVPITIRALLGIRRGVAPDEAHELHRVPIDIPGAITGTVAIICGIAAPTLVVDQGAMSLWPWLVTVAGVNVMKGMPSDRTLIGAAMVDTTDEIASSIGWAFLRTRSADAVSDTVTE